MESINRHVYNYHGTPGSGSAAVVLTNGLLTNQGGRCLTKYRFIDCLPGVCYYNIQTQRLPTVTYGLQVSKV